MRVRKLFLLSAVLTIVGATLVFASGAPEREGTDYRGPSAGFRGQGMMGPDWDDAGGCPGVRGPGDFESSRRIGGRRGFGRSGADRPLERRTAEEARSVAAAALAGLGYGNSKIARTEEFDLGYYVAVAKPDGALAVELVVPVYDGLDTARPAPTMRWNTEFGRRRFAADQTKELPVSASKARENLSTFLTRLNGGFTASDEARGFPGYYSFGVIKAGKQVAIASVNGYSGEVLLHNWLGAAR